MGLVYTSIKHIDKHPFIGQVLEVHDTPENRTKYAWYFRNKYHHYKFRCKDVYANGNHQSVHTYIDSRKDGMQSDHRIEQEWEENERMNMPEELMRPAGGNNKNIKHLLSNIEDWQHEF